MKDGIRKTEYLYRVGNHMSFQELIPKFDLQSKYFLKFLQIQNYIYVPQKQKYVLSLSPWKKLLLQKTDALPL